MAPQQQSRDGSPRVKPESHILVEQFLENTAVYENQAKEGYILFADLVGSTEFKRHHSAIEGLAKTAQHNKVATDQIAMSGGSVIKYVGDSVMGFFDGETAGHNAIKSGLAIIEKIQEENENRKWTFPRAMSTRIGVHGGKVWMFGYEQSTVDDPQGSAVDIAARLSKVALIQSLACTEEIFQAAGGVGAFANASVPTKIPLKGIKEPLELRLVAPTSCQSKCFFWEGQFTSVSESCQGALKLLLGKRSSEALKGFRQALMKDPNDFHALVYTAELLVLALENVLHKIEPSVRSEVDELLGRAMCIRPQSSRVWFLLSRLRYKEFEVDRTKENLEDAVRFAQNALGCSEDGLNTGSSIQIKTFLARYLRESSIRIPDQSSKALVAAEDLCDELAGVVKSVTEDYRKEYLVTHAIVKLSKGDRDFKAIEAMIDEALIIDENYDRAFEAKAELARIRRTKSL